MSGIAPNPLNDISKVYLEQIAEKKHDGSYLETDMKKRRKNNEDAIEDMKKTQAHADMTRAARKAMGVDEAVKGADPEMRRAAAAERRTGDSKLSPSKGKGYADQQQQQISYMDKVTKKNKNVVGLVTKEALDPVGQEDADIDNDGDSDKSDKYLLNRRKAIGKAIKKKSVKEGFSDWRQDLAEVMDDIESEKEIKEKKVTNKVKTSAMGGGIKLGEAIEEIGGTLLEMVEIDEVDFVVESVYGELLEEGYDEDDIEEALEYALTEAKVTFGHDTPTGEKKRGNLVKAVGRLARQKLSSKVRGAKKAAASAVASGARKVAKGALGVARKMEGGDSKPSTAHTKTRSSSTYRGAGAGTKERVSSGSYTPPAKKKAEKPADPWEGSATTPPKAKAKKAASPKAKAPAKKKKSSKLDDLLASVRSEEVQIDEKITAKTDMGTAIKDFYASKSPQLAGRTKEERRKAAIAAVLTARRGGKKLGEEMDDTTEIPSSTPQNDGKKMEQQRKRIQMQKIKDLTVRLAAARKGVY